MSLLRLPSRKSSALCSMNPCRAVLANADNPLSGLISLDRLVKWSSRNPQTVTRLEAAPMQTRQFSSTSRACNWLAPAKAEKSKSRKGRPRVPTGGSMRGTTVVWGDYGLRMRDHDRRISAMQFKNAEDTLRRRLRGMTYKLYTRVSANIGVYTKGGEVRMGKGKGSFDYWAARVPVSCIVLELKGDMHERVIHEAFRLAASKLPGLWETVKKGDPPMVGITKLGNGVTLEGLKRARRDRPSNEVAPDSIIPPATDSPPASISTTA